MHTTRCSARTYAASLLARLDSGAGPTFIALPQAGRGTVIDKNMLLGQVGRRYATKC